MDNEARENALQVVISLIEVEGIDCDLWETVVKENPDCIYNGPAIVALTPAENSSETYNEFKAYWPDFVAGGIYAGRDFCPAFETTQYCSDRNWGFEATLVNALDLDKLQAKYGFTEDDLGEEYPTEYCRGWLYTHEGTILKYHKEPDSFTEQEFIAMCFKSSCEEDEEFEYER